MLIETLCGPLRKARSVNQTSNGFVSKVPTATEPVGDAGTATGASVIELGTKVGGAAQNAILILPYGTGSNNNTFSLRVLGWKLIGTNPDTQLWVPINIVELLVTLSSACPGVAGRTIVATEFFADTIAVTTGLATENVVSPANDTIAHALIDLKGCQKVELSFTTGGSATDCNSLIALL